ncbi:MAG: hypothetical protein AB7U43_09910 [Desulfobacter sp.]
MENIANQSDAIINDHTGLYICLLVAVIFIVVIIKGKRTKPIRKNEINNDMITYISSYYDE